MLFGRKPKPPLALAIGMVSDAMEVAYAYLRDDKHMDTDEDVEMLDILAVLLTMNGEIANFILQRKQKRSKERSKGG